MLKVAAICIAFTALLALLCNMVDYGYHTVAVMTHDKSWDTDSFKEDRFLNATTMTVVGWYQAPDEIGGIRPSMITVTFDSSYDDDYEVAGYIMCSGPNDFSLMERLPEHLVVAANSSRTITMEVTAPTGEYVSDMPIGRLNCQKTN